MALHLKKRYRAASLGMLALMNQPGWAGVNCELWLFPGSPAMSTCTPVGQINHRLGHGTAVLSPINKRTETVDLLVYPLRLSQFTNLSSLNHRMIHHKAGERDIVHGEALGHQQPHFTARCRGGHTCFPSPLVLLLVDGSQGGDGPRWCILAWSSCMTFPFPEIMMKSTRFV